MKFDQYMETNEKKWELTGLLHGLEGRKRTMAVIMLQTISEELELLPPKYKEVVNLVIPVARRVVDTGFFPEPTSLYKDFCDWYVENRTNYYPSGLACFNVEIDQSIVKDYVAVCKERFGKLK